MKKAVYAGPNHEKLRLIGRLSFELYQQGQFPQPTRQEPHAQIARLQEQIDVYQQQIQAIQGSGGVETAVPARLCPVCDMTLVERTAVCPNGRFKIARASPTI